MKINYVFNIEFAGDRPLTAQQALNHIRTAANFSTDYTVTITELPINTPSNLPVTVQACLNSLEALSVLFIKEVKKLKKTLGV